MKTISVILYMSIMLVSFRGSSQDVSNCVEKAGIFKTVEDFNKNLYTDSVCLDNEKNKIVIRSGYVLVLVDNGKKRKYKAGEIYGYFDGKHKKRYAEKSTFSVNGYFNIIDTNGLIIYSQKTTTYVSYFSWSSNSYYYSVDSNSPIKRLRISNLEKDIKNEKFINEISKLKDLSKKTDGILQINKIYKKYF